MNVETIRPDCDRDALLVTAVPEGPVCHLKTATCFGDVPTTIGAGFSFLPALEDIIEQRIRGQSNGSYTSHLYSQGIKRIAQKLGEEGLELALAAASEAGDRVIAESADLIFYLLVLLRSRGLSLSRVLKELEDRHNLRAGQYL